VTATSPESMSTLAPPAAQKPVAGYVVAGVVAILYLAWGAVTAYRFSTAGLTPVEAATYANFPRLAIMGSLQPIVSIILSVAALAGVAMSASGNAKGSAVVRRTAVAAIMVAALVALASGVVASTSPAWVLTDVAFRAGFYGAIAGSALFTAVVWGLVYYLFRAPPSP
jgi:hypothetical protein